MSKLPGYSKLMFLTKQVLWNEDLGLGENDNELLAKAERLANEFDEGGITSEELFLKKTRQYTETFLELFEQETNQSKKPQNTGDPSNKQTSSEPNAINIIPSKNSQQGDTSFIFQSPDQIAHAIQQLAQETGLQEFEEILQMVGIPNLSSVDKKKIWFDAQDVEEIDISDSTANGSRDVYMFPEIWRIGDPVGDLDIMLTYSTSPIIIPGVTTKKWSKNSVYKGGDQKDNPDLLLVLDSSGSMGSLNDKDSKLCNAVQSCFGIIKHFEKYKSEVAVINFSTKALVTSWTKDYNNAKEGLFLEGGGSTLFPIWELESLMKSKRKNVVIVIITDGEIQNYKQTVSNMKSYLTLGNMIFMFLQGKEETTNKFMELENFGALISIAFSSEDIRGIVLETKTM